ncbi:MAG: Na+/H+ antiporter subunit E, partial [Pseudomonadota bacterium]|nr:Na+/H+ antiporter subunit E [Pseudomonadota bacterium]
MIGLFWNLLLALAWVTLTGSITAMNLLAGFIFGYVALMVLQKQVPVLKGYSRRIPRLVAFLLYFLKELVKSNL